MIALPFRWYLRFALLRLASHWRSMLTLIAGVLLAAAIGASMSLYTAAIAQSGLVQELEREPAADTIISIRSNLDAAVRLDPAEQWDRLNTTANAGFDRMFGDIDDWLVASVEWSESANLLVVRDGVDIEGVRVRLAYYDDIEDRLHLVDGAWPVDNPDAADIEIALPAAAAAQIDVAAGDVIVLDQRGWDTSRPITARVAALVEARQPDSLYWAAPSPLRIDSSGQWRLETNALTTRDSLLRAATDDLPQTASQIGWRLIFDHDHLPAPQIAEIASDLRRFEVNLRNEINAAVDYSPGYFYATRLPEILATYDEENTELGAPFGLLLLQLAALVLFFIVVIATLVRRNERREIAMLQSRGAHDRQILLLYSIETLPICAAAALLGPRLAYWLVSRLIPPLIGLDTLIVAIDTRAYIYAGAIAALAAIMLIVTLIPVLHIPLVRAGGSGERSATRTWWQRFYVDYIVLVIAGVALFELTRHETLFTETASGELRADPLLLLAPALLIFALGSLSLRLFPILMNGLIRLFARRGRMEPVLASWQVGREPLHYGRIAFLLALAVSVGWFATSFQTSLSRNRIEQTQHEVGADIRLNYGPASQGPLTDPIDSYIDMTGVDAASMVTRFEDVSISVGSSSRVRGTVIALDPDSWRDAAYNRGVDVRPIADIEVPSATGFLMPSDTRRIGIWAYITQRDIYDSFTETRADLVLPQIITERGSVSARLRDEQGQQLYLGFGVVPDQFPAAPYSPPNDGETSLSEYNRQYLDMMEQRGWIYLEASLEDSGIPPLGGPYRLDALTAYTLITSGLRRIQLRFAEITLYDDAGNATIVPWDELGSVEFINIASTQLLSMSHITDPLELRQTEVLQIEYEQSTDLAEFGFSIAYPEIANIYRSDMQPDPDTLTGLPALVSADFARSSNLTVGQKFRLFVDQTSPWFEVAGLIDHFPTVSETEAPFIIVNQEALRYVLWQRPRSQVHPNEIWVRLAETASPDDVITGTDATAVVRLDETLAGVETDLLSLGLVGLLYFSSLVGFALAIFSMVTYVNLTIQSRRAEFAVLRALGTSHLRLLATVTLEQVWVMLVAVVFGTAIGLFLSGRVLPVLINNPSARRTALPPVIEITPEALIAYLGVIIAIMALVLVLIALLVRRSTSADSLRIMETT